MTVLTMKKIKFAIILFYLLLFAGLALYDERPDPKLVREMARPRPETIEPGNAWIVILGFESREGVTPYVHGEEKMRRLQDAVSAGKDFKEFVTSADDDKSEITFRGKLPSFYGKKDGGMLEYAMSHPNEIAALLRNNSELLRRYESLRNYPRYTEPLDCGFYAPVPKFSPLRNAQRTRFLQLATMACKGDVAGALTEVRHDAEFWRFIGRNSSTLISKIISFSALSTDLRFAAELGAYRPLNNQELEIVRDILRPFNNNEASLAEALRGESRFGQWGMDLSIRQTLKEWSPNKLLFKRNATNNRMYSDYQGFIRLAELPPQQFASEVKRCESSKSGIRRIGLPFLYNSAGEILATIAVPQMTSYIEKSHNMEGLRRLSLLKVLSRQENILPQHMQQFLNAHSAELGNPYTGAPMTWDFKKSCIFFSGISEENLIDISL